MTGTQKADQDWSDVVASLNATHTRSKPMDDDAAQENGGRSRQSARREPAATSSAAALWDDVIATLNAQEHGVTA